MPADHTGHAVNARYPAAVRGYRKGEARVREAAEETRMARATATAS